MVADAQQADGRAGKKCFLT